MARVVTAGELLDGHVVLDIECPDRVYLNAYVPILQSSGQVVAYMTQHPGMPKPPPALMEKVHHGVPGWPLVCLAVGAVVRDVPSFHAAPLWGAVAAGAEQAIATRSPRRRGAAPAGQMLHAKIRPPAYCRRHPCKPVPSAQPSFWTSHRASVGWAARRGPVSPLWWYGPFPCSLPPNPVCIVSMRRALQRFMPRAR